MASAMPAEGVIVDVGNGLGTQDPLKAFFEECRRVLRLTAGLSQPGYR
jgi:hypothetical protein